MRIVVAGGTGVVGRLVVEVARGRGHDVVVLSRAHGIDLLTGDGLAGAVEGADAVVDVTSTQTQSTRAARAFFEQTTRNLLAAEDAAGIGHHVLLGIVGSDRAASGYYAGKVHQEELVAAGPVPWTILRATQFHEFAVQVRGAAALGPLVLVPVMRSAPVAAREVAERLVDLAAAGPAGRATDLAGPQERSMVELARAWGAHVGDRRRVVPVPLPGRFGRGLRSGAILPGPDADRGTTSFEDWLASPDAARMTPA
ncbi:MAG: NAD(P)H-binding protein [Aeromicrobium erythreum]